MTTVTCRQPLPDVQSTVDTRKIAIDRVGVKGITLPMTVKSVAGAQPTVATVNMYVALPAEHKGTHMSRFVALLSENLEALSEPMMRELLAKMLTLLEADGGVLLVAEEGQDLLGYVWARFVLDEGDIGNIAVTPCERRRGIGAALLGALFAEAARRKASVLQLEVRESNLAARRLYEKNGFETVGKRKNYYEKPAEDAILMSKFFQKEAE